MSQAQSHKDLATEFLKLAASGRVDEAFSRYVDPEFKHHNQYFKGDRNSLLLAMKESSQKMSNKKFEVKKIVEEGNQVVTYSHVNTGAMEIAVVHIMRFRNDLIVELWDVGQVISADAPNENGLF